VLYDTVPPDTAIVPSSLSSLWKAIRVPSAALRFTIIASWLALVEVVTNLAPTTEDVRFIPILPSIANPPTLINPWNLALALASIVSAVLSESAAFVLKIKPCETSK